MKRLYCVYCHMHQGKIFYIGSGIFNRAMNANPHGRNHLWQKKVSKINEFEVGILYRTHSRLDAVAYEIEQIKKHKPQCNIRHGTGLMITKTMPVKNPVTIKKFNAWLEREGIQSIEIAAALNVSPSCLSRWRERGAIPNRHQSAIKNIVGLSKSAFQSVNYNEG